MHDKIIGATLPSVQALSFLGDAVHSLYVRRMLVGRGLSRAQELNERSLSFVTAEAQARMLSRIEGELLPDELAVARRASNSTHLNKPKRASGKDYRAATAFEAVLGMLFWLGDEERISYLLDLSHKDETAASENEATRENSPSEE